MQLRHSKRIGQHDDSTDVLLHIRTLHPQVAGTIPLRRGDLAANNRAQRAECCAVVAHLPGAHQLIFQIATAWEI